MVEALSTPVNSYTLAINRCLVCQWEVNVHDPHDACIGHNSMCFVHCDYDLTNCAACLTLIEGYKANDKLKTLFFGNTLLVCIDA